VAYEIAQQQWREGERRLAGASAEQLPALHRVTQRIGAELRRRLGGPFSLDELADLYDEGTSWCADLAYATAPGAPWAWDVRIVADAAFYGYQREAVDYAGGRRVAPNPDTESR
jgi:hypothetical protein